jgi:hypothetical protein
MTVSGEGQHDATKNRILSAIPLVLLLSAIGFVLFRGFVATQTRCEVVDFATISDKNGYFTKALSGDGSTSADLCTVTSEGISHSAFGVPGRERIYTLRVNGTFASVLTSQFRAECLRDIPANMADQVASRWSYAQRSTQSLGRGNMYLGTSKIPWTLGCPSDSGIVVNGVFEATDSHSKASVVIVYTTGF